MYADTSALEKIEKMGGRINVVQGGTGAGKTTDILITILDLSFETRDELLSITTDTLPNLKRNALRDWKKLLAGTRRDRYFSENKSDHIFTNLCTGFQIEFFSTDNEGARGARRDYLFVNEANRISWETFSQLETRTRKKIWLDFNPVNEFWAHKELLKRPDTAFLKLNYLDNEALPEGERKALEMRRGDGTSNWWKVYGLGEIGSLEGNVYEGWLAKPEEEIRKGKLIRYGLDFGFSNDETALVAIYELEDGLGLVEEVYEKGILPSQYPDLLKSHNIDPSVLIVADGARPEIIAEIKRAGYRIIPADKSAGSVKRGIQRVQERKIYYYGKALEREFLTYAWRQTRTGETLDEPQDGNDHLMDAIRYAVDDLSRPRFDF